MVVRSKRSLSAGDDPNSIRNDYWYSRAVVANFLKLDFDKFETFMDVYSNGEGSTQLKQVPIHILGISNDFNHVDSFLMTFFKLSEKEKVQEAAKKLSHQEKGFYMMNIENLKKQQVMIDNGIKEELANLQTRAAQPTNRDPPRSITSPRPPSITPPRPDIPTQLEGNENVPNNASMEASSMPANTATSPFARWHHELTKPMHGSTFGERDTNSGRRALPTRQPNRGRKRNASTGLYSDSPQRHLAAERMENPDKVKQRKIGEHATSARQVVDQISMRAMHNAFIAVGTFIDTVNCTADLGGHSTNVMLLIEQRLGQGSPGGGTRTVVLEKPLFFCLGSSKKGMGGLIRSYGEAFRKHEGVFLKTDKLTVLPAIPDFPLKEGVTEDKIGPKLANHIGKRFQERSRPSKTHRTLAEVQSDNDPGNTIIEVLPRGT